MFLLARLVFHLGHAIASQVISNRARSPPDVARLRRRRTATACSPQQSGTQRRAESWRTGIAGGSFVVLTVYPRERRLHQRLARKQNLLTKVL